MALIKRVRVGLCKSCAAHGIFKIVQFHRVAQRTTERAVIKSQIIFLNDRLQPRHRDDHAARHRAARGAVRVHADDLHALHAEVLVPQRKAVVVVARHVKRHRERVARIQPVLRRVALAHHAQRLRALQKREVIPVFKRDVLLRHADERRKPAHRRHGRVRALHVLRAVLLLKIRARRGRVHRVFDVRLHEVRKVIFVDLEPHGARAAAADYLRRHRDDLRQIFLRALRRLDAAEVKRHAAHQQRRNTNRKRRPPAVAQNNVVHFFQNHHIYFSIS